MKALIIEEAGKIFVCGNGKKKGIISGSISEIDFEIGGSMGNTLRVYGHGKMESITRKEIDELEVLRATPVKVLVMLAKQYHEVLIRESEALINGTGENDPKGLLEYQSTDMEPGVGASMFGSGRWDD